MWKSIIENIKEYLYIMGKDPNDFGEALRTELRGLGVIDGGESMIYKDPNNAYTFKIDRIGNDYVIPNGPEYTCIITILNDVGVKIGEMRFSEFDCVRVLGSIAEYIEYVFEFGGYDNFNFNLGINSDKNQNMIELSVSDYDSKPFTLKFKQYNPHVGIIADLATLFLEYEELVDLAFRIFFQCIIDLDYSVFYQQGLERELIYLEGFVIDDNCTFIQNKNGYFDMPKEYDNYFNPIETHYNDQIQPTPYTCTGTPQIIQNQTTEYTSDTQISNLRTSNKKKNTVLGLYSSKGGNNGHK